MDDYKKDNSSYEPNFVMKDPDPETVEHETSQESTRQLQKRQYRFRLQLY